MQKQESYTFKTLEKFLNESANTGKCLIVKHESQNCTAIMHVFQGNFCGDWKSGDGILFYSDGETHSAEPDEQFLLVDILTF